RARVAARFGNAPSDLRVSDTEIAAARAACDPKLLAGIEQAAERIRVYHERQAAEERAPFWRDGHDGAWVGEESRAVDRAGCLVPGGLAPLASTVLMTVIPARVAGVGSIAVCATPGPGGIVHPATLAACAVAGADEVFALGGPAAVAALAYGTESVAPADVIVGPGSIWTTIAKHEVCMDVGVDSFAGPTEVAIVADDTAPPLFVAADLVAQAEHDPLATAILITTSPELVDAVERSLVGEVAAASRRDDIERALKDYGRVVIVEDLPRAIEVANFFAAEHLELMCRGAEELVQQVRSAGAVFVGPCSPVALGDYVAGTNHVLPTAGSARFASPLRVSTFIRSTAIVAFERRGLDGIADALIALADAEGLDAHARALRVRMEQA
ncbi:MAG TPA: histidinol dehydrogenase, partial [Actinomycetota bacterium]|nr:histidinol dehydrogenase [Actinomycetota bacterium]